MFDNFDQNGNTRSGENSTHDTVAILAQKKPSEIRRKPKVSETTIRKSQRSFDQSLKCQKLTNSLKPAKDIIMSDEYLSNLGSFLVSKEDFLKPRGEDFAWLLCRMNIENYPSVEYKVTQNIPSWSAFNSATLTDNR